MRFLADESCDAAVVRGLREAGHDVAFVAELSAGSTDQAVLEIALAEQRVLITKDKDFGALVFAGAPAVAVILLRYPPAVRSRLPRAVVDIVAALREELPGSFVVVTPAGARVSRLPPS